MANKKLDKALEKATNGGLKKEAKEKIVEKLRKECGGLECAAKKEPTPPASALLKIRKD